MPPDCATVRRTDEMVQAHTSRSESGTGPECPRALLAELVVTASDHLAHRHAFAGAKPQQIDLELGERGQDVEEHLAHPVGRVVDRTAQRQEHPACHEEVADGAGVGYRSGQPIQLRTRVSPARTAANA